MLSDPEQHAGGALMNMATVFILTATIFLMAGSLPEAGASLPSPEAHPVSIHHAAEGVQPHPTRVAFGQEAITLFSSPTPAPQPAPVAAPPPGRISPVGPTPALPKAPSASSQVVRAPTQEEPGQGMPGRSSLNAAPSLAPAVGSVARVEAVSGPAPVASASRVVASQPAPPPLTGPQTLETLQRLMAGRWGANYGTASQPYQVEFRYDWGLNKTVIRGEGVVGVGRPDEVHDEMLYGWDAARKGLYMIYVSGGSSVYFGTGELKGQTLSVEFETRVGEPGRFRSVLDFADPQRYRFTTFVQKEGVWQAVHTAELVRLPAS